MPAFAAIPSAGGDTTVVKPSDESAVSVTEDAVEPETPNIKLVVPVLSDSGGGTPSNIRILSVSGGTLWTSGGSAITLGANGTSLSLTAGKIDLRFRPDAGRDVNASFRYVVVDPHDSSVNSAASIATIPITAVNDAPIMQTLSGNTGIGLAATYYLNSWELTGTTYQRIDSFINFANDFNVPGINSENFSTRWTGQFKAPITGSITFNTSTDDGVRLWVNDVLIIDQWKLQGETAYQATVTDFVLGELYDIRMEFYERGGGEVARLRWQYTGQSLQTIPQASLFPATTRAALNYINGAESAIIDDAITITDVDSAMMSSGTVVISSGYEAAEDSLLFTNQNGITGSYSNGTLTLVGSATKAQYQTALRSVRYANSEEAPTTTTRTIEFTVFDGHVDSNFTYRNITFGGSNSAPEITEGASTSVTMDQNSSPIAFSLTLNATDADYHSIEWSILSAASHGTASVSGNGDFKEISYTPTTDYSGSDSFVVQISDGMGGTDTITVNVTITERVAPVISNKTVTTVTSTSATMTWTTDEDSSTKVSYGLTSSYGSNSSETDTSPRVTSHSKTITGLLSCTTYHYAVISLDAASNTATSTDGTFTTGGCAGDASVTTTRTTGVVANGSGSGSITMPGNAVTVNVPTGYIANNITCPSGAQFQLKSLAASPVKDEYGIPSGKDAIVSALDLSAYCPDLTRVTTFDQSLTVTFTYSDEDIRGMVESSLKVYRYGSDSTDWEALTCTQDAALNTLTCSTTKFSSFALFGSQIPASESTSESATRAQSNGGCRGSNCRTTLVNTPLLYGRTQSAVEHAAAPSFVCAADSLPSKQRRLLMNFDTNDIAFDDVSIEEWYACYVHAVMDRRIFSGYRNIDGSLSGQYGPADLMTNGQLAKIALMLSGGSVPDEGRGEAWSQPYVDASKKAGFTVFANTIDANTPATRGAVIQTILESLKIEMNDASPSYSDVPVDSLYAKAIATATNLEIVSGDDDTGFFRPTHPINRAEVAKMIVLALGVASGTE